MHQGELVQERYALEARVGRGGMAEVWRAHDQRLNRVVAIKFLAPGLAENPEFLLRLFNEARSVAAIANPHVTAVLDYGTSEPGPYLVMEYVPGGTLSDLTGEPMQPERAVDIMRQVAEGAGAAHIRGIIHRDIKPGNVLLCDDGSVKLADFGIASTEIGTKLTATGAAIGSPHYISPEQAMGEVVTPRADVYSMGVCLYELLTGSLPFDGSNPTAIAISHVEQLAEPPSSLIPELDPDLDALVMRCLEKQPEARFADGNELAAALAGEDMSAFAAGSDAEEEADTSSLAAVAADDSPGVLAARFWNLKRVAGAVILLLAVIALAFHLSSGPSVAEASGRAGGNNGQPSPGSSSPKTPRSKASGLGPSPVVSPSSSPSPKAKKHKKAGQSKSSPSHHKKPKASQSPAPAPSRTPTPTPTASPTPTPTPTSITTAAAPAPTTSG
ncbi:MAG: eukaryotic-like serine/threonine-protein kinase [Acidobacteriota bacterium]|nr:eukaryotic-like serine/threonine-protein kinase [Acidobacteriota bacterium]